MIVGSLSIGEACALAALGILIVAIVVALSLALAPLVGFNNRPDPKADRGPWTFQCVTSGESFSQPGTYEGTLEEACDFISAHGIFEVRRFDDKAHIIYYAVDWVEFRAKVPCKWCAIKQDAQEGGHIYTEKLTRSEALKQIMGGGSHTITTVDDENAIVFYRKNV